LLFDDDVRYCLAYPTQSTKLTAVTTTTPIHIILLRLFIGGCGRVRSFADDVGTFDGSCTVGAGRGGRVAFTTRTGTTRSFFWFDAAFFCGGMVTGSG
jgi:hypothetical protein